MLEEIDPAVHLLVLKGRMLDIMNSGGLVPVDELNEGLVRNILYEKLVNGSQCCLADAVYVWAGREDNEYPSFDEVLDRATQQVIRISSRYSTTPLRLAQKLSGVESPWEFMEKLDPDYDSIGLSIILRNGSHKIDGTGLPQVGFRYAQHSEQSSL